MSEPLADLAELVGRVSGIRIGREQHGILHAALRRAAPGTDPEAFLRLASDRRAGAPAVRRLIDEVTVQETYFFRERGPLEALDWRRLAGAAAAAGSPHVRVWVTACATGEEAYTMAILAREAFAPSEPPVRILATDISERALERARAGVYGARSVRPLTAVRRRRWLHAHDRRSAVAEPLRRLVEFRRHNLVRDAVPPVGEGPFELITCRNVLIYFAPRTAQRVRDALDGGLADGGVLLLGTADVLTGTGNPAAGRRTAGAAAQPEAPSPAGEVRDARAAGAGGATTPARDDRLAHALHAAGQGRTDEALADVAALLRVDPLDADAHLVRGFVELAGEDAEAAVRSLRRALYLDPSFGLAAFLLASAHAAAGRPAAALRGYERALRTLDGGDERHAALLQQVNVDDVAAACRARIAAAGAGGGPARAEDGLPSA